MSEPLILSFVSLYVSDHFTILNVVNFLAIVVKTDCSTSMLSEEIVSVEISQCRHGVNDFSFVEHYRRS
jgi:hypothetical protein